ncbi:MAG TPA: DUF1559 domain-containing protein [Candidatus Acidoferrum sp.]|nr:DUF1559 domain-containing protein [Candidatus Acidoferrum sp.]
MKNSIQLQQRHRGSNTPGEPQHGFTLIELGVVLGTLAVLALLLAPALAGTRMESWRLQCQNNLRQLQVGIQLFTQDHGDMFPAAGYSTSGGGGQVSWDSWIYNYVSGGQSVTVNQVKNGIYAQNPSDAAMLGLAPGLPVMACPVDATLPKVSWMHTDPGNVGSPLRYAIKSYEMNSVGTTYATEIQVDPQNGKYPLPDLNQPIRHGVGIYWYATSGSVDWDAKGYKTSVVKDAAGTILLAELASNQNVEGNIWPCVSAGPWCSASTWSPLYQTDVAAPTGANALFTGGTYSEGLLLYPAHGYRFNYLFHDGHVAALRMEDTVGKASGPPALKLTYPLGMWTVKPND